MIGRFVEGARPPPGVSQRFFPVVRPQPDKPFTATFLGQLLAAFWTHDQPGEKQSDFRSIPCYFPSPCEGCKAELKSRWWGFGQMVTEPTQTRIIAQLSLCGAEQVEVLAIRRGGLRGLTVEVLKAHDLASGAFVIRPADRWTKAALPEPHPMDDSLKRLWRVEVLPVYGLPQLPAESEVPE